jgi:hypothetical protein
LKKIYLKAYFVLGTVLGTEYTAVEEVRREGRKEKEREEGRKEGERKKKKERLEREVKERREE